MLAKPLAALAGFLFVLSASADISGNYTLSSNQTFTSIVADTFTIGAHNNNNTFNLQTRTATFSGAGEFEIHSKITGTGAVRVELTDPTKTVRYLSSSGNSYTGTTTVRSGILSLETPEGGNNGILGNLVIGGGPNQAIVTRSGKHNRELIADTSMIRLNANGILEFGRMDAGDSPVHESLETFRSLILNGGTLLNSSQNTRLTTVNILDTVQLLANSVIDLGVAMTISIGDVANTAWTPGALLTIKNWSPAEPVYVGQMTAQQLGQVRFDMPGGLYNAAHLADGQLVPTTLVPEASAFLLIPLLAGAALWPELKRRRKTA